MIGLRDEANLAALLAGPLGPQSHDSSAVPEDTIILRHKATSGPGYATRELPRPRNLVIFARVLVCVCLVIFKTKSGSKRKENSPLHISSKKHSED